MQHGKTYLQYIISIKDNDIHNYMAKYADTQKKD